MSSVSVSGSSSKTDNTPLEPPYRWISTALRQGSVIPFLGSGASTFPTGTQLAQYLAEMSEFPPNESIDLAKVAQYFEIVVGRKPLEDELRRIFKRDSHLTSLHTYLASIEAPLLIITTNYDGLMEKVLRQKGCPFDVIVHATKAKLGDRILWWQHNNPEPLIVVPNKINIDLKTTTVIYKMHGTIDGDNAERDQFVITENDYIEFLARMTKNRAVPAIFAEAFQKRPFLFLGYSLQDWNLRVVLHSIEKELRRPKDIRSWAIRLRPSELERRFWQERGVDIYDMDVLKFVEGLT